MHSPLGGITQDKISWQNRPTFQQVVEYAAHRGDNIANLAPGKTVSATSAETGFYPSPASNAIDGNASTRWASDWSDDQAITVDLGSVQPVSRVALSWESAYGKGYRIQTSADAVNWTDAAVVTNGNGGQDNLSFAPTQARFVSCRASSAAPSTATRCTNSRCTRTEPGRPPADARASRPSSSQ